MKTVQRKGLNFEGQNVYIGIDVHKKKLASCYTDRDRLRRII